MSDRNRVTTESLDKEAESIRKRQEAYKKRKARKHLQDLEELFKAVLECYRTDTGNATATVEELTAYYAAKQKKEV